MKRTNAGKQRKLLAARIVCALLLGSYLTGGYCMPVAWGADNEGSAKVAGTSNITNGTNASAWGDGTTASGVDATAFGKGTAAEGLYATAFGIGTTASGEASTAFGGGTTAQGERATAFGEGTKAVGRASTVWGREANAYGNFATAWGGGALQVLKVMTRKESTPRRSVLVQRPTQKVLRPGVIKHYQAQAKSVGKVFPEITPRPGAFSRKLLVTALRPGAVTILMNQIMPKAARPAARHPRRSGMKQRPAVTMPRHSGEVQRPTQKVLRPGAIKR